MTEAIAIIESRLTKLTSLGKSKLNLPEKEINNIITQFQSLDTSKKISNKR